MSAQKHSLQTQDLARFGSFHIYIYIYDLIFFKFSNIYFVLGFVGKVLEMTFVGALEKNGAESVSTSRRPNVAMSRGKIYKPYLVKKI